MKLITLIVILNTFIFGQNEQLVPVSKKPINWKGQLTPYEVKLMHISNKYNCKKYLNIQSLKDGKYRAKHYILKDKAICAEDVYIEKSKKIKFNFGLLEIERSGEVVRETDDYIKIKNRDGKIEKIYKDGRER
ncbi:MAG: hypothetical protein U9Q04_00230 [Campylobacterota bacterium]|nr:hypothetical protein [Campylobacterota bacterium]